MSEIEKKIFKALMLSMGYGGDGYAQLCAPVRRERYRRAVIIYKVIALIFCVAGLVMLYMTAERFESWHNQNMMLNYSALAAMCLCLFLYLGKMCCESTLLDDRECLDVLYKRFQTCGSVQEMLNGLEEKETSVRCGPVEEEPDMTRLKLFSNVFAKAAYALAALLLAVGLFSGGMHGRTLYGINRDGFTLISWRGEPDENGVVSIPETVRDMPVTAVGKRAFANQKDIRKVIVPDSVEMVNSGAFMSCTALEEVVLPDTLTTLGAEVFRGCTALKSFTAPASLTEIRADAFRGCSSLESVVLHDGITAIHAYAFYMCEELTSIVMPAAMPGGKISEMAFAFCEKLSSITLPEDIVKISEKAFQYCNSLERLIIPLSVEYLGYKAFDGCRALKNVYIPKGCELAGNAFGSCRAKKHRYSSPDEIPQEYREAL